MNSTDRACGYNCTTGKPGRTPNKSGRRTPIKTSPAAKAWKKKFQSPAKCGQKMPVIGDWDKENQFEAMVSQVEKSFNLCGAKGSPKSDNKAFLPQEKLEQYQHHMTQVIDAYKSKLVQEGFDFDGKNPELKDFVDSVEAPSTQETLDVKIPSHCMEPIVYVEPVLEAESPQDTETNKRADDEKYLSLVRGQPVMLNRDQEKDSKTMFEVFIKVKDLEHVREQFNDLEKMLKAAQIYHCKELKGKLTYRNLIVRNGSVKVTANGLNTAQHLAMFAKQEGYRQGARFHLRIKVPATMHCDNLMESAPKILESLLEKAEISGELHEYSSTSNGHLFCYADVAFMKGVTGILENGESSLKLEALEGTVDALFNVKKAKAFVENENLVWGDLAEDYKDCIDEVSRLTIN